MECLIGLGVFRVAGGSVVGVKQMLLWAADVQVEFEVLTRTLKSMDVFSFGNSIVWLFVGVPARPVVDVGEVSDEELGFETIGSRPRLRM